LIALLTVVLPVTWMVMELLEPELAPLEVATQ
jgi:hypothetical protein